MNKVFAFIKRFRHYFYAIGIIACLMAADQVTKHVVKENVQMGLYPGIQVIKNFFYITYSENHGAMNGMLDGNLVLLIIITVIALGIFVYLLKGVNFQTKKLYSWSLCLIVTGTLGNFLDRLFNDGGVVDFLSVYPLGMGHDWGITRWSLDPWPTFNIADCCLVIGVISLAIYLLFFDPDMKKKKEDKDKPNVPTDELKEENSDGNN